MRGSAILFILLLLAGCARGNSVVPEINQPPDVEFTSRGAEVHDPHMLSGEWDLYFNESHDRADVVPKRAGRFHLNALKFLEEYCEDCLKITSIQNNGDSTINLNVQIRHPFPDNPEYTGFDVKGIIMFNGSWESKWKSHTSFPFYNGTARVSYREYGDPELLNPDGYTPRWCPEWPSDNEMPIFNYWPGKYTNGEPTANINGFINFYTDEERHMFRVGQTVTRTYHIALPPGPVVASYAVDACWEPPTVTPVTDPLNDFPFSANQPEPYYFRLVLNNDEVIEDLDCCGSCTNQPNCEEVWIEWKSWYIPSETQGTSTSDAPRRFSINKEKDSPSFGSGICTIDKMPDCLEGTGPDETAMLPGLIAPGYLGEGKWRFAVAIGYDMSVPLGVQRIRAYDIVDVEVDFP
ncbi:MAG TPA: hypothetical protein VGB30_01530 [bacterium]|jgi:hypothetical protein